MKKFNTTGTCIPSKHYMVDLTSKINQIQRLIEEGEYFTINRARQYGKTTTFSELNRRLDKQYHIIWLSFEGVSEESFENNRNFVETFIQMVSDSLLFTTLPQPVIETWQDLKGWDNKSSKAPFDYLSRKITRLCKNSEKEFLLLIDEVDKISDNQVFLNFLGMLRSKYLFRNVGRDTTFQSVILAGVYDIKNLKLKLRPNEEIKYNSPWNIAADFTVDMSFSPNEIAAMLQEYEQDHHTGMDIQEISEELYFYTNGYPFLVSYLCKWVDEEGEKNWTKAAIRNAEKSILKKRTTLLDDLIKNVENNEELKNILIQLLYYGKNIPYHLSQSTIQLGTMLGIFTEKDHMLAISNLIFETYLYDYTINLKSIEDMRIIPDRNQFIQNGKLNMPQILCKFQEVMRSEYRKEDEEFIERQGRLLFLCFLKPIINGTGFYYIEPETRCSTRMDIVIAYGAEEYICELKIWHGEKYRAEGIAQLEDYLEARSCGTGYLVSFSFLKNKTYTNGWISKEETQKNIYEIVV